ncbi:MAG TPA: glycosyltransferase [Flavipsychrobacter sp.]|nr:glycosyltransferase [Flavipsychrobacter sp.]
MKEQEQQLDLSLVIPCYNEAGRIELLYKDLAVFMEQWHASLEVIIINDGSKDNTLVLLQEHPVYKKYSNIISIYSQENTGKGGALKNGVLRAKGNFILTLDADMATAPAELFRWIDLENGQLSDNTIYIGSREHTDSTINNVAGERKAAGNIFNFIVRMLTPLKAHDTQCGFKLYPARLAKNLFTDLKTYGWAHDVELLYHAVLLNASIKEMPVYWTAIADSKIRVLRDGFNMFLEVFRIVITTKLQSHDEKALSQPAQHRLQYKPKE